MNLWEVNCLKAYNTHISTSDAPTAIEPVDKRLVATKRPQMDLSHINGHLPEYSHRAITDFDQAQVHY